VTVISLHLFFFSLSLSLTHTHTHTLTFCSHLDYTTSTEGEARKEGRRVSFEISRSPPHFLNPIFFHTVPFPHFYLTSDEASAADEAPSQRDGHAATIASKFAFVDSEDKQEMVGFDQGWTSQPVTRFSPLSFHTTALHRSPRWSVFLSSSTLGARLSNVKVRPSHGHRSQHICLVQPDITSAHPHFTQTCPRRWASTAVSQPPSF
jgi:hypothetical protein